jgi:uncharacterized membrane protein YdjX (TVP38/TMEM64 family)
MGQERWHALKERLARMNMTSAKTLVTPPVETAARSPSWPVRKLALALLVIAVVAVYHAFDLGQYLSFEFLKTHRERLLAYAHAHYAMAVAAFILLYCVTAAFSVPGDIFLTMVGGFLFGPLVGTLYVNIGATAGATLAFLAARYLLRDWVESKYGHQLGPIQEGFKQNAFSYLVTLRLIPAIPFVLVNLVSGLTRIEVGTFVRATSLGMIPASFVFAYAGRQLGMINSIKEIASPPVLLAFTLLGLLALTPVLYRRLAARRGKMDTEVKNR